MATIPSLPSNVAKLDTLFTTTWMKVRPKAIDNILDSNVVTAALRADGCFKTQRGGRKIERTVRYGTKTAINVKKGDTLPTGEDEADTVALFDWKYTTVHVQRSYFDDQINQGESKIKDLVQTKIEMARDALDTQIETGVLANIESTQQSDYTHRAARDPLSIQDLLPTITAGTAGVPTSSYVSASTANTYLYGGIDTADANAWWCPKGVTANSPRLMNFKKDLTSLYNYCTKGGSDHPNLIVVGQTLFEAYEDICENRIQLVQDVGSPLAKLGYDVLKFKGARFVWTPSPVIEARACPFVLNTKWIDVVYDPSSWFQMIPWDYIPNSLDRITRIVCAWTGIISGQLRRHGTTSAYTS